MAEKTLVLVHEREEDCLRRLKAEGFPDVRAMEITSYLAQSTDMEPEFQELAAACRARGIAFRPMTLDAYATEWRGLAPESTLVWTLTDGIAFFSGSTAPALARLGGFKRIGAEDAVFALCQDKFRSGAVLAALGLALPPTALARNGVFLSPVAPIADAESWFVKPNRLGAKIGIYSNSHCYSLSEALDLSRRIYTDYGDDAVVQSYIEGKNLRASFLDLDGKGDLANLGIWLVDSGSDFQTMDDSLALYGETGATARAAGAYSEPVLTDLRVENPAAASVITSIAGTLMTGLGLRDVFSMDLRIDAAGGLTLIEFEVCPGLPCFDFRHYVSDAWGMSLSAAMAGMAARLLA